MFKPGDRVWFNTHPKPDKEGDPIVPVRREAKVIQVNRRDYLIEGTDKIGTKWNFEMKIEGDKSSYQLSDPAEIHIIREGSKPKFSTPQEAMDFLEGKTTNSWVDRGLEELLGSGKTSLEDLMGDG